MQRRRLLAAPLLAPWLMAAMGPARATANPCRLAAAWRVAGATAPDSGFRVGLVDIDWAAGDVRLHSALEVPSRAHGLAALPDGGYAAVANRPGRWVLRCDAAGALARRLDAAAEQPHRSFNGHVEASADGQWLYSSETDATTGAGWLSVRDTRTLQRVSQFSSGGIDPHALLRASDGHLLVANGGIVRDALGRKIDSERMAPSLARIDPASGRLLGRWNLPDPQLSIRHLAWAQGPNALLGVALQSEHASPGERAAAPALAVWDGRTLTLPCPDPSAGGYVGDIAAGPGGGFVVSAQKQGRVLRWLPAEPDKLTLVAQLTEPCALVASGDEAGVLAGAALGAARWHLRAAPRLLPWPAAIALDNHWVRLAQG